MTVGNAISGGGAVAQNGSGTIILTGANSYGGADDHRQGTLQIGGGGASGTLGGGAVSDNR